MPASVECLNASCSAEENWPAPEATRHVDLFFIAALSKEQEKVSSIMKRLKVHLFVCVVGAVLIPLLLAPTVAQAAAWTVVSSPNPGAGNGLFGVASISATDIWAVGAFFNTTNNVTQTLIEQWNGTSWSVVTSPNPSSTTNLLEAAAADKSSGQAWAVGEFTAASGATQTLTEFNP